MTPRQLIHEDALAIRAVASKLEALSFDAPAEGPADLEQVGNGYLAAAIRLERLAATVKGRGAAYLGL